MIYYLILKETQKHKATPIRTQELNKLILINCFLLSEYVPCPDIFLTSSDPEVNIPEKKLKKLLKEF